MHRGDLRDSIVAELNRSQWQREMICEQGAFFLAASGDIAADEQVFIGYGNDQRTLLADYGFVDRMMRNADLEPDNIVFQQLPHFAIARHNMGIGFLFFLFFIFESKNNDIYL